MNHTGQYTTTLTPVIELYDSSIPWHRLWEIVRIELVRHDFAASTINMYRTVLRSFASDQRDKPRRITESAVQAYVSDLTDKHSSWSWIASNICILRTVFDKLGGMKIVSRLVTPKRPTRLPEILNSTEIQVLFKSAIRPRDRLLLALIYGCGLRTSEVCNLKWQDIDMGRKIINIPASYHVRARQLAIPEELCAAFIAGKQLSTQAPYVFTGNNANRPLSTRTLQQVIREIARKAGIGKLVTAMTLRHTYAVHLLEMGANIREVQEQLGHTQIDTTLIYQKCFLPKGARSPLDTLKDPSSSSLPIRVHPWLNLFLPTTSQLLSLINLSRRSFLPQCQVSSLNLHPSPHISLLYSTDNLKTWALTSLSGLTSRRLTRHSSSTRNLKPE